VITAVAPLVAHAVGRDDRRTIERVVHQGFWVALAIGVPAAAALWQARDILLILGQTAENATAAAAYVQAVVFGLVPNLWLLVLRGFVTALGRTRALFLIMLFGILANGLGNYALMFGHFGMPAFGLQGAGISTSVVFLIMFLLLLGVVVTDPQLSRYRVVSRLWRPDWRYFREILRIGLPIGGALLIKVGLLTAAALLMGLLGTAQIAAHQIALNCSAILYMVPAGLSQAATVRVGIAVGRHDRDGVRRAGWVAIAMGIGFLAASALLLWAVPRPIVGLFLPAAPSSQPIIALAASFLVATALSVFGDGVQVVAGGVLRGLKDTRTPMVIATLAFWGVGFPASALFAFPLGLGGVGIWLGLALSMNVVAVLLILRFHRRDRLGLGAGLPAAAALRP
jgi:MATE family multidrug resistance protein